MPANSTIEREVTELRSEIRAKRTEAATLKANADKLVADEKAAGRDPIKGLTTEDKEAFARIDAAYKAGDTVAEEAAELDRRLHALLDSNALRAYDIADGDPRHPAARAAMSLGLIAAGSEAYKAFLASNPFGKSGPVNMSSVEVASRAQTKAILTAARHGSVQANAGDGTPLVPTHEELVPPVAIPKRQMTVLDLITVSTTMRDAVTYTRQTSRTTAATTTVAYGTALNPSRYQYETVPVPVLRKGHYAVVDEGNVADQEEFQSIIDDELITDLQVRIENDILNANGNGTTEWEGILQNGGIGSVDADDPAFDNRADALHHALTTVRIQLESEPTAWGLDPEAFEAFWLEKDDVGRYLHNNGPAASPLRTIWGVPALVSTGYAKPIVGDWAKGAKLWIREGIAVSVSNNVDDFFLEGLLAIKAQIRAAFAVRQPKAFCAVENYES